MLLAIESSTCMSIVGGWPSNKVDSISPSSSRIADVYVPVTCGRGCIKDTDDPFFMIDLGRVIELYRDWVAALPTVTPFYAFKCNTDPALLKTLAALGTGFDCSTKAEIKTVLELGVAPDRIIYAHPCKLVSHLQYTARNGVDLMTFDNEFELLKVKEHIPKARLVLRIKADDPNARFLMGNKFGCSIPDGKFLLSSAKSLHLKVVGICFHIGHKALTPIAYESAIEMAAEMFVYGFQIGYQFNILDIGGGFLGDEKSKQNFLSAVSAIKRALEANFSPETYPGLRIIAEPGTYFACSTHTIAFNVIGKRLHKENGEQKFWYYFNEGIYGSLKFRDETTPLYVLKNVVGPLYYSKLFGPTLASEDSLGEMFLPELDDGDWLYLKEIGAYSSVCATSFNGFSRAKPYYYITKDNLDDFEKLLFHQ